SADAPSPTCRELLGQHYTETHYSADAGADPLYTSPLSRPQDHCFYQGHVRGYADSAASISTCNGLSGFFRVNETTFLLEPLAEDAAGWHAVYRAAHLRGKRGTCRESSTTLEYDHEPKIPAAMKLYPPLHKGPRYVELVLVVDNEEVSRVGGMLLSTFLLSSTAVRRLEPLYQPLRLRVALIGLEVWSHKDKIMVSPNPEVTLDNFLHWREAELLRRKPHDNAQLITGIDFHGTTVGLAKKLVMCTRDSGGVNQDHSMNPIGAASTMAHEMGHNLGMSHDEDVAGCRCPVPKSDGGCVMAASVGLVYPKLFSRCSEHDMWQFLVDPRTRCLLNVPRADELYGGPVCGNQFVERGEQCDCGTPEECSDRCCNATTCQLREGAECARGDCCQDCKVKAASVLCRPSKNDCDLPEHCTGLSPECPEDVFQENGIPCQNGKGYCYNGACPSHGEQCRALWGAGKAQVAPDVCFKHNSDPAAGAHGHFSCRDVKCGTLLCLSDNASPVLGGGSYSLFFGRFKCKAVIATSDAPPACPQVCYAGRCQNLLVYGNKNCSAKCNHHGVCNHKRECHCEPGWAAPYCEQKISEMTAGTVPSHTCAVEEAWGGSPGMWGASMGWPRQLMTGGGGLSLRSVPLRVSPWYPSEGLESLLSSHQAKKPKPPSKPLPALKSKVPCHGEGPPGPALPQSLLTPASGFQRGVPSKVALKPPPARR
uniref:ADAM metallopeptidase domain 8 n=1 Tax=Athene cunicularia TaxID=194338 RepID=A0A663LKA7_ATHCN